jgi:hypothetical protein
VVVGVAWHPLGRWRAVRQAQQRFAQAFVVAALDPGGAAHSDRQPVGVDEHRPDLR